MSDIMQDAIEKMKQDEQRGREELAKTIRAEVVKAIKEDREAIAAKLQRKRLGYQRWLDEPANRNAPDRAKVQTIVAVLADVIDSLA